MPYVEEVLRHDNFLDDLFDKVFRRFEDKEGKKWWMDFNEDVPKVDLYQITYEQGLFVQGSKGHMTPTVAKKGNMCITRHIIMRRWDGELLGFAQSTGAVNINTADLPKTKVELMEWFTDFYKNFVDYTTVYSYMLEDYLGFTHYLTEEGEKAPVTIIGHDHGVGVLKASLDVEFFNEGEYYEEMRQSPIVTMHLKGDLGNHAASIGKLNYKTNNNWWGDSLIQLAGVFDETSAFFTLKVDSAPTWEDNEVTKVPFFFGNLEGNRAKAPEPTPPPPPEPVEPPAEPDPTKPSCGQLVNGASDHAVFTYDTLTETGEYYITYNFYGAQDRMYVKVGDTLLHDTGVQADMKGSPFKFTYDPADGPLVVQLNDEGTTGTAWEFMVFCPSTVPQEVKDALTNGTEYHMPPATPTGNTQTAPKNTATDRNTTPIAMLGGTQVAKFFDYDNIESKTEILQPTTRNYVKHPSNGVDSIMVKRTKYGARYQEHFLSWQVPPHLMPPTREELRVFKHEFDELSKKLEGECTGGTVRDYTKKDTFIEIHHFHTDWNHESDHIVINKGTMFEIMPIKGYTKTAEGNTLVEVERGVNAIDIPEGTMIDFYSGIGNVKRKYPRAWNYLRYGYYQYGFHPSRYSGKTHASRATVVHPEDGALGYIPNIILLPAINIMEGDKLKFPYYCQTCIEEPYVPAQPDDNTRLPWLPQELVEDYGFGGGSSGGGTGGGDTGGGDTGGGDTGGGDTGGGDTGGGDTGGGTTPEPEEPSTPTEPGAFSHHCDNSIAVADIDDTYWQPSETLQGFMVDTSQGGIGREVSTKFWDGRNDFVDFFTDPNDTEYLMGRAKITVKDFHKFLWKSLQDVQSGAVKVTEGWADFKAWCDTNLTCLTDLEKASLFMTARLQKPVLFFPGSEGYLAEGILDGMIPLIKKVPSVVYDWIDFNNVYEESAGSAGTVGAWVIDNNIVATFSDGTKENILETFKSYANFEPQLLQYPISAAKAHRPSDYIKPNVGFGSDVVGGEYTSYYVPTMTDSNFLPFVAGEVAIHEMAHALSNYGYDVLGEKLHDMQEWLDISGWVKKGDGSFDELIKSNPGTTLDNGKLAPVSDYGCFMPAEDFAEAFMVYTINPNFLKDKFTAKYDFIKSKLTAMGIS